MGVKINITYLVAVADVSPNDLLSAKQTKGANNKGYNWKDKSLF